MKFSACLLAFAAVSLSACGGVRNMQSVKSSEYGTAPKSIVAILNDLDPTFPAFKQHLTEDMAKCGIRLQFVTVPHGQASINVPGADSLLLFKQLAHETTTRTQYGRATDQYVSMYRFEVTLTDLASKKTVWKGQGDFRTQENSQTLTLGKLMEQSPAVTWSRDLMDQMKTDGLIGPCDGSKVQVAAAAATATAPAPTEIAVPATVSQPLHFKIAGGSYETAAELEAALRSQAAKEVAQISPMSGPHRGGLIVVFREPRQQQITGGMGSLSAAQAEQVETFTAVLNKVGHDADVDAIRKSGLFDQVTAVIANDVDENDFRGAGYKLWYSGKEWLLAKQGGGRQKVSRPPAGEVKLAQMTAMLTNLQAAATALDSQ